MKSVSNILKVERNTTNPVDYCQTQFDFWLMPSGKETTGQIHLLAAINSTRQLFSVAEKPVKRKLHEVSQKSAQTRFAF